MSEQVNKSSGDKSSFKMWKTDTKSIVMLLMLSVAASAIQLIAFQIDRILFAGTGFYVGHVTIMVTWFTATVLFGPMGFVLPVMTAAVGGFTGSTPGAWYWIVSCAIFGLIIGWLSFKFKVRENLTKRLFLLALFYAVVLNTLSYAGLYTILLKLPVGASFIASLPYAVLTFVAVPLAIGLIKAIDAAKLGV